MNEASCVRVWSRGRMRLKVRLALFCSIFFFCLALFFLAQNAASAPVPKEKSLVRVYFGKPSKLDEILRLGLDIASFRPGQYLDALVSSEESLKLQRLGIQLEVIDENPAQKLVPLLEQGDLGLYHTYQEMKTEMLAYAQTHAAIVKVDSIGSSVEGRAIWAMKISDNVGVDENEPEVLYMGNHHAREIMTVEIPMRIMSFLINGYGTDTLATRLVDTRETWLVPMVNPDGHVYVENGSSMWRKNRRNNGDGSYGVDLNRNYGYMWGYDNIGSSPTPSSEVYRGTGPFSEPEIDVIRDFCEAHDFIFSLSYHSYGEMVLYPWGYIAAHTPDRMLFTVLGDSIVAYNNYVHGNAATGTIYLTNGDTDDWVYGEVVTKNKTYGITFEVNTYAQGGFAPPGSLIGPTCELNLKPSLFLLKYADDPLRLLPPATPLITPLDGDPDGTYTLEWSTTTPDPHNPAQLYELVEMSGKSRITDGAESGFVNFGTSGFTISSTRKKSGSSSFYGGKADGLDSRLSSVEGVDVASADSLKLWCWYDIESNYDYAYVEMSADGGMTFESIPGNITTNYDPHGGNAGNGITGSSGGWVLGSFPLSQFSGKTVWMRIRYQTDQSVTGEGLYADDVYPLETFATKSVLSSSIPDTFYVVSGKTDGVYYYHVRAIDSEGHRSGWSQREDVVVTLSSAGGGPSATGVSFGLKGVYPNPFDSGCEISFFLDKAGQGYVLRIFDLSGREVKSISGRGDAPGMVTLSWDGKNKHGERCSSGLYVLRLEAARKSDVRKAVLLKGQ
ncbi:MAG: M14 family zinc carboxypeptidase [Candidatus Eisenbacteria bacterium]|nr:M14 family zinc carboxypeptidase [Candidatus Eisenbacteria bacterium]